MLFWARNEGPSLKDVRFWDSEKEGPKMQRSFNSRGATGPANRFGSGAPAWRDTAGRACNNEPGRVGTAVFRTDEAFFPSDEIIQAQEDHATREPVFTAIRNLISTTNCTVTA